MSDQTVRYNGSVCTVSGSLEHAETCSCFVPMSDKPDAAPSNAELIAATSGWFSHGKQLCKGTVFAAEWVADFADAADARRVELLARRLEEADVRLGLRERQIEVLCADRDRLRSELEAATGCIYMTVDRLGGTVEGRPTARLNFLQRIDELREKELALAASAEREKQLVAALRFYETSDDDGSRARAALDATKGRTQ